MRTVVWNAVRDTPFIISGPVSVSVVDYGTDYVELEIGVPVNTDATELSGSIEVRSGGSVQTLSVTISDVVNGVITKRVRLSPESDTVEVIVQLSGSSMGSRPLKLTP